MVQVKDLTRLTLSDLWHEVKEVYSFGTLVTLYCCLAGSVVECLGC